MFVVFFSPNKNYSNMKRQGQKLSTVSLLVSSFVFFSFSFLFLADDSDYYINILKTKNKIKKSSYEGVLAPTKQKVDSRLQIRRISFSMLWIWRKSQRFLPLCPPPPPPPHSPQSVSFAFLHTVRLTRLLLLHALPGFCSSFCFGLHF